MDFVAASHVLFPSNIAPADASAVDPTSLLRRVVQSLSRGPAKRSSQRTTAPRIAIGATPPQAKAESSPKASLLELGEAMLRQSRRDHEPLSLLVFELDDLPELEAVFGQHLTRMVLAKTTTCLRCLAMRRGLAAWTTPTIFTAVVPGVTGDRIATALEATLGPACCIELESGEDEILLVPEYRVQTVGQTESLQQAYDAAYREITKARLDRQRREHYLTRERESHSRPAPLQAAVTMTFARPKRRDDVRSYAPMQATVPVPFGPRV